MKPLNERLCDLIIEYCIAFEAHTGIQFMDSVRVGQCNDVLCFGDYYFGQSEIFYVVDNKIDVNLLIEWYDKSLENYDKGKRINLPSYVKGLRFTDI